MLLKTSHLRGLRYALLGTITLLATTHASAQSAEPEGSADTPPEKSEELEDPNNPPEVKEEATEEASDQKEGTKPVSKTPEASTGDEQETPSRGDAAELDRVKGELNASKSANIIRHGVTIGLGFGLQSSLTVRSPARESVLPYLAVFPAYFWKNEAVRHYCAASWGAGDEHESTEAAKAIARKWSSRAYSAIVLSMKGNMDWEQIGRLHLPTTQSSGAAERAVLRLVWKSISAKGEKAAEAKADALEALANLQWDPTRPAPCGSMKWGLWVGKPLDYEAEFNIAAPGEDEKRRQSLKASSLMSFGGVFAPNAHFSLLAGVGPVVVPAVKNDGTTENVTIWNIYVAVGGNLDLLGVLFR